MPSVNAWLVMGSPRMHVDTRCEKASGRSQVTLWTAVDQLWRHEVEYLKRGVKLRLKVKGELRETLFLQQMNLKRNSEQWSSNITVKEQEGKLVIKRRRTQIPNRWICAASNFFELLYFCAWAGDPDSPREPALDVSINPSEPAGGLYFNFPAWLLAQFI